MRVAHTLFPHGRKRMGGLLKPHYPTLLTLWRFADGAWIAVAYWLSAALLGHTVVGRDTSAVAFGVAAFFLAGEATGLYGQWRGAPVKREVLRVWWTWGLVVPLLLLLAFATKSSTAFSRLVVTGWFVLTPVLLTAWRGLARLGLQEIRRRGRNTRSVAVVGATRMGEDLARLIIESPWLGLHVGGFYDDRQQDRRHQIPEELGRVRGSLDDIVRDAKLGKIDIVYITLPARAEPRINAITARFADSTCSVYLVPDFYVSDLLKSRWSSVGDIPVVSIFESPFYGVDGWLKRVEDIVLGSLILSLIALPMAVIALGVKLTSRGPVLFRQRRYGLNGHPIDVLKFRTMSVSEDGPFVRQATKNDPRVTRFGGFLRRSSLDELPQFLHVMTGKMSIVGPRPHAVSHNEEYRSRIHGYMLRHKVKPGITGWAQVNGWRGETDTLDKMQNRVEHDLDYIRNWGLGLDLRIIFLTVFGSGARRNAY